MYHCRSGACVATGVRIAIRKTDPDPIGEANAVLVDSDAPTNAEAIREIDE